MLVVLCVALVTGCQTETAVVVDVAADGSGAVTVTVTLDAEASDAVGDLSEVVELADVRKAGWRVVGPEDVKGGGSKLSVTRPFENVDQANAILAGLTGPDGPMRNFELVRSSTFASTKISAKGALDLSKGLATFDETELSKSLDGAKVGDIVAFLNKKPLSNDQFSMSVRVAPEGMSASGTPASGISARPGAAPVRLDMVAKKRHTKTLVLAALAVVTLLGAVWLALFDVLPGTRNTRMARNLRKQRHSGRHGWRYVEQRTGMTAPPPKVAKSRRGKHERPRRQ